MIFQLSSLQLKLFKQQKCLTVILIISLFTLMACEEDVAPVSSANNRQSHSVQLIKVKQQNLPVILTVPGKVVVKNQLKVASRITGFIEQINFDEGDIINPGDVLVKIDNAQIEAAIKGANAAVLAAKAELMDAEEDVKRVKKLVKSKLAAEDDLRNANVRKISTKANLVTAEAEFISKRKERRYVNITSSVKARVRERFFDPGELATVGQEILLLDVLGGMELEVYLPSTSMSSVTVGQTINVVIDLSSGPQESKVNSIVHAVDDVTRRYKVRLSLPGTINLTAGQFGVAHIVLRQQSATVIPDSTITQRAGIEGVFVADASGVLRFRSVRLGKNWENLREILAGLKPDELVVNHPTNCLRDGDKAS